MSCSIKNCAGTYWAKGFCRKHYYQDYCAKNREKIAQYNKAKYWANPDGWNAKHRSYYRANSKTLKIKAMIYYEKNAKRMKEVARQYRLANPGKCRDHYSKRQAQIYGAGGSHTNQQIIDLLGRQRGRCAACRANLRGKYQKDHIQALSRGGTNDIKNIQLLCAKCNNRKRAKDPITFMQEKGFLL